MTSVPEAAAAAASPGTPHHTMPAPARIAAWLTNIGAPVMPVVPPTTITPPTAHLCVLGTASGSQRRDVCLLGDARGRVHHVDADVGDGHRARVRATGLEHEAGLRRRERDRPVRVDGRTRRRRRSARRPRTGCRPRPPAPARRRPPRRPTPHPLRARRESPSRTSRRPRRRRAASARARRARSIPDASSNTSTRMPQARSARAVDEPVAPVVPLAAHDHRVAPVRAAADVPDAPCHRAARALHQHVDRGARRDRARGRPRPSPPG